MTDLETLKKQLIRDEGMLLHAYQDSLGYWSIGVGRLIDERKHGGISQAEAMYLLNNDIAKHTKAVVDHLAWIDDIGTVRLSALINMHFQLGDNLWKFTKTLKLMEAHKWEEASKEILDSKWAKQTPERAKRISEQVRTNKWT